MFLKGFKSRLCFYINLDFLQFHLISAKIYISQIYLLNIKSFTLKNEIKIVSDKIKSSLFLCKSLFATVSFYICQNTHFTNISMKF